MAQEILAVSAPQSHRYYSSKEEGLFGLPSPNQEQQVHRHGQINYRLSEVLARVAVVMSEVGKWLVRGAEMSQASESG